MGLLKSLFGGGKKPPPSEQIKSPQELHTNDLIKMEFSALPLISGQTLKVSEQIFYDISAVESCKTVSILEGADQRIFLSKSSVNPDRPVEVAVSVLPEKIFELFNREQFIAIFDEPDNTDHRIDSNNNANAENSFQGFIGNSYYQERTNEAYRSSKDCRETTLSDSDWISFDYKLLVTDDRHHAIRIEVYDGGRTDVYLIAYLSLNKIESYWPASQ